MADEVPRMLARVVGDGRFLDVRHQSGDVAPGPIVDAYVRARVSAKVSPFVDDVPAEYRWADLVITRAGAGTLAELAVAGLPALLVPLADAAHDHQSDNAASVSAAGAALWTREGEWDARDLARRVVRLLTDRDGWRAMSASARRTAAPGAADNVVDECEALMGGRG
jgi:UDP-N-acetylglucosamine--N-acetylmuramyl-(pentapeptide) pyrophosphoryl-undecaprenol N-acetylglucosamine transferase